MLTYQEFEAELIKALGNKYPGARITKKSQYKFNKVKKGLLIEGTGNKNANPVVYPENLYEAYQCYEDMELILENLDFATDYEMIDHVTSIIKDFNQAKQYIYPYVINAEKNLHCMECTDYIYLEKLDLLYGAYMEVPDDNGRACINITQDILKKWNVSEEEVISVAKSNAQYNVKPMKQVMAEIIGIDISELDIPENNSMYVVRSETHTRGAAGMFDMDLLKRTAEQFQMKGFYIFPSSIFEIILLSNEDSPKKEMLKEMVEEINRTQLKDEEYLSDHIYFYDTEADEVVIVETE